MRTFLFYDLETSGLNKAFDQVLQFAAIRTDGDLRELSRHECLVRLNPDCIPGPKAVLTHRLGISALADGLLEVDAIQQIHALLNTPETISIGYNSLQFDDEFLRFSFYRNLLPPYTHQYAKGCMRMDVYPMALMSRLFGHAAIEWPVEDGKPMMKLELLNAANQWVQGQSHDAMVDVEATLGLARALKQDEKVWQYLANYFVKKEDINRIGKLPHISIGQQHYPEGIYLDGSLGAREAYQTPVIGLGAHQHYHNQTLWLRLDKSELAETTPETIAETTWCMKKKFAEPGFLLPPREDLCRYLSAERLAIAQKNKVWLDKNPELLQAIAEYHQTYTYTAIDNVDIDASLYLNDFYSKAEQMQSQAFLAAPKQEKINLLDNLRNPILQEQALRLIGRNYPEELTGDWATRFAEYLQSVMAADVAENPIDYRGKRHLSPCQALQEIESLQQTDALDADLALLDELEKYLEQKLI